tara:strand:- start:3816 stop:3986 length:171 start_codon:yes stop_codon:yes gene_type:complete
MELRWLNNVLQYRTLNEYDDYASYNPRTGQPLTRHQWTEWKYVPIVREEQNDKKTS